MTKRITSEDCEGNIEDIEDGRYNSHVVPVSAEDDPGYEEIDYGDCTEFTVPLGRYGSHVVPIGGGGSGGSAGAACPGGGLKAGTNIDGKDCLSVNLKQDGAIILDNGQLAIDTSKLKITTDQVYPSGTNTGIVINGPDGESWNTQYDYNQWLYDELKKLRMVHFGQPMPTDPNLGALWTDDTNYKQYVFNGTEWVEVTSCTGDGEPKHETYIEFYRLKVSIGAYDHNNDTIDGCNIDIWWNSTEGKDYYDGEWYWEVDMLGDDNWVKHEDLPQDFLDSINFMAQGNSYYRFETSKGAGWTDYWAQHPEYPCARARLTASNYSRVNPNDFTIATSGPCPLFPNDTYAGSEAPGDDKYFPICKP